MNKGQKIILNNEKFSIRLDWVGSNGTDLDLMALELDEEDTVVCSNLVFYNNLSDPEQAIRLSGKEIQAHLSKLNPKVVKVLFLSNIFNAKSKRQSFRDIENIKARVYDGKQEIEVELEYEETATTVRICSLYRTLSGWKLKVISEGITSTLSSILSIYGLSTDDKTI